MFEGNKKDLSNQTNPDFVDLEQKPVEDIFTETDKSVTPASQAQSAGGPTTSTPHISSQTSSPQEKMPEPIEDLGEKGKSKGRNFLMIILIIIILAGLGYAGWWAYNKFIKNKSPFTNQVINQETNQATNQAANINQILRNLNQNINTPQGNLNSNVNQNLDSDGDGLTDEEELGLGSSPNSRDTDNDNLNDYQEVKVYLTNPINSDSDGDGYLDGEEVLNGYDPLGPGRLE